MKMLVAVDGSDSARRALEYAIREAKAARDLRLHLLNVQVSPEIHGLALEHLPPEQWHVDHQEAGRQVIGPAEKLVEQAGLACSGSVVVGAVAQTIVEQADRLGCDHIVLGTRGMTALKDLVLGSVAQKVVHLAHCPVTLVK